MTGLSLQFHALPSEISGLFGDLINNRYVRIYELRGNPFTISEIVDRERYFLDEDKYGDELVFCFDKPNVNATSLYEFKIKNENSLILSVGKIVDGELRESWLSSDDGDKNTLKEWKKVFRDIKSKMFSGSEAVNPHSGATSPMRWHRFTKLTHEEYLKGLKIVPVAGNSLIRLPDDIGDS